MRQLLALAMILEGVSCAAVMRRHATITANPAFPKALGRAFRWKRLMDAGSFASVSDIARAEKLDRTYVGDVLRLTLLAPEIVEAILEGKHSEALTLPLLLKPSPLEWAKQPRSNGPAVGQPGAHV